jgi:hypothetical protein
MRSLFAAEPSIMLVSLTRRKTKDSLVLSFPTIGSDPQFHGVIRQEYRAFTPVDKLTSTHHIDGVLLHSLLKYNLIFFVAS